MGGKWPDPPEVSMNDPQASLKLELYRAQLDVVKAQSQAEIDREKANTKAEVDSSAADCANDFAVYQEVYKGYIEVAKGQIDRSLQRAEFVQKVAAAAGSLYAAIVGLSFSIKEDAKLPVTGIVPAIFLGLSFVLAAVYVAYLTDPSGIAQKPEGTVLRSNQDSRRDTFILWTRSSAFTRRYFLQTSVVSMGFGILTLPAPYLARDLLFWWLLGLGVPLTFLIPKVVDLVSKNPR